MLVIGYGTVVPTKNLDHLSTEHRYHGGLRFIERGDYTMILIESTVRDFAGSIVVTGFPSYPINGLLRLMTEVFNSLPGAVEPDLVIAYVPAVIKEETDDTKDDQDDKGSRGGRKTS